MLDAIPGNKRGYFLARGLLGVRDEEAARADLEDYRWGIDENSDSWFIRAKAGHNRLVPRSRPSLRGGFANTTGRVRAKRAPHCSPTRNQSALEVMPDAGVHPHDDE